MHLNPLAYIKVGSDFIQAVVNVLEDSPETCGTAAQVLSEHILQHRGRKRQTKQAYQAGR